MSVKLAAWAALLICAACQSREPERATQTRVAPAPASLARKSDSVKAPGEHGSRAEQLELLAVGDSIGPQPLEVSPVGTARLRAELADKYTTADTTAGRFLAISSLSDSPRLLYRASRADTVWMEFDGLFDRYEHGSDNERGREQHTLEIQQANLDGQGRPEVLVNYHSADYGSGGGTTYTRHYLLDVTSYPPRLLLQARTGCVDEAFGGYAAMHGYEVGADFEEYTGFERTVKLRPREVVVGPFKTQGHPQPSAREALTQLPAGRYRYQHGRMYRVRGGAGHRPRRQSTKLQAP